MKKETALLEAVGGLFLIQMPLFPKNHENHENHLCSIVQGWAILDDYKALVDKPNFVCTQCGRVANKEENLCSPTTLAREQGVKLST